jgi:hypothetical protein
MYGSIKEESWTIRTNKEREAILQRGRHYKIAEIKTVWTY